MWWFFLQTAEGNDNVPSLEGVSENLPARPNTWVDNCENHSWQDIVFASFPPPLENEHLEGAGGTSAAQCGPQNGLERFCMFLCLGQYGTLRQVWLGGQLSWEFGRDKTSASVCL